MKKVFTIALFIATSLSIACSQQADGSAKAFETNGPEIKFEFKVHDFGTLQQGGDGTIDFKFKNVGNAALVLNNVKASCGCTTPNWPKNAIKPGEEAIIKVTYDTKRLGPINKNITVYSNANESPLVLKIKGNVEPKPAAAAE